MSIEILDTKNAGVLLFGHGSRIKEANDPLIDVASIIREKGIYKCVEPGFLELAEPDFITAVDTIVDSGATSIILMPYFLYTGIHLKKDLPKLLDMGKEKYPDMNFVLSPNLGFHPSLVDITMERLMEVSGRGRRTRPPGKFHPHPIEAESFRIIESEVGFNGASPEELTVIKRVIHATADFDYKDLLEFSPGALEAANQAIRGGADVITDVKMVEAGISKLRLSAFGGKVRTFISDKDVTILSKKTGSTRSAQAMRKAAPHMDGAVVAIGNAPTALRELLSLVREGKTSPAVVVGVPVGFVGAAEAKEELVASGIEYVTVRGRKGGSTIAVSIVNALMINAAAGA